VHGITHESSVSLVAVLMGIRAVKKGFDSTLYFFGIGSLNCLATRGVPTIGAEIFPGMRNENTMLERFIREGGKVYACRLGLSLHGAREEGLMDGVNRSLTGRFCSVDDGRADPSPEPCGGDGGHVG